MPPEIELLRHWQMPRLSAEEERELATRSQQGDVQAEQKLLRSHLGFVISIAKKYRRFGVPMNDLVQEGMLGLLHAIRKFDPARELRLSTYARWWVKSSIQDYVARSWSLVRVGTSSAQKALFFKLRRKVAELKDSADGLNEEVIAPIARRLGVPLRDAMALAARVARFDQSLNERASDEGRDELIDRLADDMPSPEDTAAEASDAARRRGLIARAMKALSDRERRIIVERHLAEFRKTRDALGAELGITAERVRQLEGKALRKLARLLGPLRREA
jgi:RNA polymerase sigma-32 factor